MREEKAIRLMRNKDPDGLKALMDRYIPYVSAIVWSILRSAMTVEDAEEVASDVFLAAWEQADDLQTGKVKAWLGAVARNKAKNALRSAGHDLPLEEDVLELPDDSALERMERREEALLVRQAVDSLPPRDREIFLRHYYYAQPISDISREMRMPEATVKTRLRRGRMKLKEYLIGRDLF
ncbi:MAG: sigma-70 family RNA polymerase sigma factor [Oscillospiraceae bacterium]|nr:sigma-70 family RNA polymerase sigma factor [Oscillospiraceae bacterium]